MADVGIKRIEITDQMTGRGAWRFKESRKRQPAANSLYRFIFERRGTPLLPGYEVLRCTKNEFIAGYDYALGIDVILTLMDGQEMTMQEKFLFTTFKTVTVEYMQDPNNGEQGDWFNMKAQLYFVGYDRIEAMDFQDWILLNWSSTQMETRIHWRMRPNNRDGARANFRYADFNRFPPNCVIACSDNPRFEQVPEFLQNTLF
jgi:hypothetical protein